MKERRYARKPLFYIEQPNMSAPKAEMQESYRSGQKRKKQKSAEQQTPPIGKKTEQTEEKPQQHKNEKNIFHEQLLGGKRTQQKAIKEKYEEKLEEPVECIQDESKLELSATDGEVASSEQEEALSQEKHLDAPTGNIPFEKLDIRGKVNYFLNKPALLPDMKCEVRTADQVHYGVIDDLQDELVQIRKKKLNNPEFVPLVDIKSIRIIGF